MELKLTGKYVDFYERHSDTVIALFCQGLKCSEISKELEKEFNVKIPFQSLVNFYCNNKEYLEDCKKKKRQSEKDDLKEIIAINYCEEKAKELLFLLTDDLAEKVKTLSYDQQVKLIPTIMNTIAKLGGLDKPEVNIGNNVYSHEIDDAVLGELMDVINSE